MWRSRSVQLTKYHFGYLITNEMGGECCRHEREAKYIRVLEGTTEGKRQHARLRRKWEDIIKMALKRTG